MGFWDLLFPSCDHHPAVISQNEAPPDISTLTPETGNCINCHQSPPPQAECSARIDWPRELYRTIPSIQQHPQQFSWWQENNRAATWLRAQQRQHALPVQLNAFQLDVEVKPNEASLSGAADWILTEDSVLSGHLFGRNLSLLLGHGNLVEASDSIIGGLRLYFQQGEFSTNSCILNSLLDVNSEIAKLIPVAYDPNTHRTYTLREYLDHYFDTFPSDADIARDRDGEPLYSPDQNFIYEGLSPRVRNAFIQVTQSLQGGEASVLIRRNPSELIRFPYLFELAVGLVTNQSYLNEIDLARLFPELVNALSMQTAQSSNSAASSVPLAGVLASTDYSRFNLDLRPSRIFWNQFDVEFDPESRVQLGLNMEGRTLRSIRSNSHIRLKHLFVPGVLRLAESRFDLTGQGPQLNLALQNIDLNLAPFDVNSSDLAHRGSLHVASGRISDGTNTIVDLRDFRPGIHLEGDIRRTLRLSTNLEFNVSLGSTQGDYDISGQVLATNRFVAQDLEPGQSLLQIRHLNVADHRTGNRWIEDASITLSDLPARIGRDRSGFLLSVDIPRHHLPLLENYSNIHLEMFIPVERVPAESIAWVRMLDEFMTSSPLPQQTDFTTSPIFDFQDGRYHTRVLSEEEAAALFRDPNPLRVLESQNSLLRTSQSPNYFGERDSVVVDPEEVPSTDSYHPDLHLQHFSTQVRMRAEGRRGVPSIESEFRFSTAQESACERNYDVSGDMNHFATVLGPSLELILRNLHLALSARHRVEEGGSHHFMIHTLEASANTRAAPRAGLVQGPVRIFDQSSGGRVPLQVTYQPVTQGHPDPELDVRNLRLRFDARNLVHPALADSSRDANGRAQVTGLDIAGILRTDHWIQNLRTQSGRGLLCLRGSPTGDIFFLDEHHRRLPVPLLEDSLWCSMGLRRVDTAHQVLYGAFYLDLGVDLNVLRPFGFNINSSGSTGIYSDNIPWSGAGYNAVQAEFLRRVRAMSGRGTNP